MDGHSRGVPPRSHGPVSYLDRLMADLETVNAGYQDLLSRSSIRNIDPNRRQSNVFVVGAAQWGWAPSDPALEASRMSLLRQVRDLRTRMLLLFPHPTPQVTRRLTGSFALLESWSERPSRARDVPSSINAAEGRLREVIAGLDALRELLPADEFAVRLVLDTNALLDCPDIASYTDELGSKYRAHVLPTALSELDDLKRSGRTPELRASAQAAVRRLKMLRQNGDVRAGATVAGGVSVVFQHVEPRGEHLPDWLDLTVGDDRLAAAALLLQSEHPGSAVVVATSDINLQTKLAALGLPYVEPPEVPEPTPPGSSAARPA